MKLGIYKHSKTSNECKVHFIVKHSETLEDMVVYEALYNNNLSKYWVRPLSIFEDIIEIKGNKIPRFVYLREK